jgi:hypothetical protein
LKKEVVVNGIKSSRNVKETEAGNLLVADGRD